MEEERSEQADDITTEHAAAEEEQSLPAADPPEADEVSGQPGLPPIQSQTPLPLDPDTTDAPTGQRLPIEPGVVELPDDVRQLVDQRRPRGEVELPLDDARGADNVSLADAVGRFVSSAEQRKRELDSSDGEPAAMEQTVLRHGTPPGQIERDPMRHDDVRGSLRQLSQPSGDGQSSGAAIDLPPLPGPPDSDTSGDRVAPLPRLQLVVQIAESRVMYDEAIAAALDKKSGKYRDIAKSEVEDGLFEYDNKRRAADWRMRGP